MTLKIQRRYTENKVLIFLILGGTCSKIFMFKYVFYRNTKEP